jgi:hypothetical protein
MIRCDPWTKVLLNSLDVLEEEWEAVTNLVLLCSRDGQMDSPQIILAQARQAGVAREMAYIRGALKDAGLPGLRLISMPEPVE